MDEALVAICKHFFELIVDKIKLINNCIHFKGLLLEDQEAIVEKKVSFKQGSTNRPRNWTPHLRLQFSVGSSPVNFVLWIPHSEITVNAFYIWFGNVLKIHKAVIWGNWVAWDNIYQLVKFVNRQISPRLYLKSKLKPPWKRGALNSTKTWTYTKLFQIL